MRILYVIHKFLPFSSTGVENYTYLLAKRLSSNHDVLVYTSQFDPLQNKYSTFEYKYDEVNVKGFYHDSVHKKFESTYSDPVLNERFFELISEYKPDLVHFQHLLFHSIGYSDILQSKGIPAVLTVHDFHYYCPNLGQKLFLGRYPCKRKTPLKCALCYRTSKVNISTFDRKIYKEVVKSSFIKDLSLLVPELSIVVKSLRVFQIHPTPEEIIEREKAMLGFLGRMNLIISPSRYYKDFYYRFSGHPEIVYLDYGFEENISPKQSKIRGERLKLGFVGTISRHKGAHLIIDLAKKFKDSIKVYVWGNDKNDLILSKRLKNQNNIEYKGEFKPEEKEEAYRSIDYLIVPSIWEENSPLVIHESLLYGTPVIASKRGGNVELIKEGKNGFLFDPDIKDSLFKVVYKLLTENIIIDKPDSSMVVSISSHVDAIEELYNKLLS